jgi:hypothetical protein
MKELVQLVWMATRWTGRDATIIADWKVQRLPKDDTGSQPVPSSLCVFSAWSSHFGTDRVFRSASLREGSAVRKCVPYVR